MIKKLVSLFSNLFHLLPFELALADLVDQSLVDGLVADLADVVDANVELVALKRKLHINGPANFILNDKNRWPMD